MAIYTYKLKDDYKEGNLRIVPEVRKKKNLIAGANTQVETLWEMHNLAQTICFRGAPNTRTQIEFVLNIAPKY